MNCARSCENLLNYVNVMPKKLLVPFFSGHGVGYRKRLGISCTHRYAEQGSFRHLCLFTSDFRAKQTVDTRMHMVCHRETYFQLSSLGLLNVFSFASDTAFADHCARL